MDDYYEILQVQASAELDIIKSAYRTLAKKYHPDVETSVDAEERMTKINLAYATLSDPEKRAIYDKSRESSIQRPTSAPESPDVPSKKDTTSCPTSSGGQGKPNGSEQGGPDFPRRHDGVSILAHEATNIPTHPVRIEPCATPPPRERTHRNGGPRVTEQSPRAASTHDSEFKDRTRWSETRNGQTYINGSVLFDPDAGQEFAKILITIWKAATIIFFLACLIGTVYAETWSQRFTLVMFPTTVFSVGLTYLALSVLLKACLQLITQNQLYIYLLGWGFVVITALGIAVRLPNWAGPTMEMGWGEVLLVSGVAIGVLSPIPILMNRR